MSNNASVVIDYINWRGERRNRRIRPVAGGLVFASTWLLIAVDEDIGERRMFALKDIHSWTEQKRDK